MPLDYLNEASEEEQCLFARLNDVERTLRNASEERRPMIGEERYLTGEEGVCPPCAIRRCCAAIPAAAGPAGASPGNDRRLPGTLSRPGRQPSGPP